MSRSTRPPSRLRRTALLGWLLLGAAAAAAAPARAHPPPRPPPTARIFGGTATPPGDEPPFLAHFATAGTPATAACTGVLITPRHVLTLASCGVTPGTMVRLGTATAGAGGEAFRVAAVNSPPYRNAAAAALADNVAVVTFVADAVWTAARLATFRIVPVALDGGTGRRGGGGGGGGGGDATVGPPPPPGGLVGRVWGWGTPNPRRDQPLRPSGGTVLRQADAVVVETEACSALFAQARGVRPYDVYCAKKIGQGPCVGDRGAGLVSNLGARAEGEPYVHGLYSVSWSSTDYRCVTSFPQGYTAVRSHAAWIRTAVAPQQATFVTP